MAIDRDWWKPENLKAQEKEHQRVEDLDALDVGCDFGSYRRVLLSGDIKSSKLDQHNDLHPGRKIRALHKLLKNPQPKHILDVGCGMGFTTKALARFYTSATVLGVDISTDAITFARKTHKDASFLTTAVSPQAKPLGKFDLIYCFEFYPFTRTDDYVVQAEYLEYFASQLAQNGEIVIYQLWENPMSLSAVLNNVAERLPNLNFSLKTIPNPKLTDWMPTSAAWIANSVLETLFCKKLSKTILLIEPRL